MSAGAVASVVLGLVLLVSGAAKLASPAWPVQARDLGAPGWAVPVVPWVEVALGAVLAVGLGRPWTALAAAALLAAFTLVVGVALARGQRPPCACFGRFSQRPISGWTVVRNVVLIAIAAVAAAAS